MRRRQFLQLLLVTTALPWSSAPVPSKRHYARWRIPAAPPKVECFCALQLLVERNERQLR